MTLHEVRRLVINNNIKVTEECEGFVLYIFKKGERYHTTSFKLHKQKCLVTTQDVKDGVEVLEKAFFKAVQTSL